MAVSPLWRAPALAARALVLSALIVVLAAFAAPSPAAAARVQCAGTFRVLHDDRIGPLSLPKGNYSISILASGRPTCGRAAALFTGFLEDFDGKLPGGWRVGAANSTFLKAPAVGFHVRRLGSNSGGGGSGVEEEAGGGGRHPAGGSFCPATFRVLNRDRIGALQLAAGRYWIARLGAQSPSCAEAAELFARFLADVDGILPSPWVLQAATASFTRGQSGLGFRVKPAG